MRPTTSPTTAMSTSAAMIVRRNQRGAWPGATVLDHELVKLDQRHLLQASYRVISPPLLGHGLSIGLLRQESDSLTVYLLTRRLGGPP
jgi:hypothetical protein